MAHEDEVSYERLPSEKSKLTRAFSEIDEDDHSSRAHDAGGTFVGRYNRFSDQTYDKSGRVVTLSGDALTALIFEKKRKR